MMSVWKIFFSFKGRISRSAYWCATAARIVVSCICILVFVVTIEPLHLSVTGLFTFVIGLFVLWLFILTLYCGFPIGVKHWHDRNKSGWWILIEWIPLIGPVWTTIECGFLKGTDGPNRFGPSPLL